MVTSGQSVIWPDTPLFLVDRSWRSASEASRIIFDWQRNTEPSKNGTWRGNTGTDSTGSPRITGTTPKQRATEPQCKNQPRPVPETARAFEFINATGLDHARDPHIQRLVKSHARKGIHRHKDLSKTSKVDRKKTPSYTAGNVKEAVALDSPNWGVVCSGSASPFYGNKANGVLSSSRSRCLLSYCMYRSLSM